MIFLTFGRNDAEARASGEMKKETTENENINVFAHFILAHKFVP